MDYKLNFPVWQDQKITFNYKEVSFPIYSNDFSDIIATIHAYARPGKESVDVALNSIIADYLKTEFPDVSKLDPVTHVIPLPDYFRTFKILAGHDMYVLKVTNNYSYDESVKLNVPWTLIRPEIDPRMPLIIHCVVDAETAQNFIIRANYLDGTSGPAIKISMPLSDDSGTVSHVLYGKPGEIFTVPDNTEISEIQMSIAIGNKMPYPKIKVTGTGCRYALYYVDAYGYWRWLVVDGRAARSDSYQRHNFKRAADSVLSSRENVNYQNDITRTYRLSTGWLTDDQAGLMHHLIGSVNVMLYDMEDGSFTPVVLTDASCDYKTYKGESRAPVTYTITAQVAKDFVRR
ncbi:MAG: hypothetical protein NC115_05935 [Bacteroidales bacterium]|nr:hypothetical protein [Bacteroidales bacterium]